ncbi:hypothetical protein [Maribacter thermophilus]|nr:hypothetical protein [Maribacter thermophilus]
MKNKRTFLASIALGIFLLATVAPIVNLDDNGQQIGIEKRKLTKKI